jgi:hypothetical protein
VAIRRRFPAGDARHRRELAEALNNLADTRHDLGDVDGALVAAREAAGLCAALYDDGDHEDDGLYVYVLCTLATVEGARDLDSAVSSLVTARRVARESGDDTLMPVVRTALAELGPEARTRRVWRTLTGDPYP